MKDVLADIVRQSAGVTQMLRVTGTPTKTLLKGMHENLVLFIEGELKNPIPEFVGEFGLSNLGLLSGLLDFPSYRAEGSTFSVRRMTNDGEETVEKFQFRDGHGVGADYRATSPRAIPTQPVIRGIAWDVTLTPSRSKLAEFQKLATLFGEIKVFGARTTGGNLVFSFGSETDSTNSASMVFETGVTGTLRGDVVWPTASFLQMIKLAADKSTTLRLTGRHGIVGVEVETDFARYQYYLRGERAQ